MVNSGLLEFSDDQKVRVDINAETGEVVKAVTIDADDVETPIGGGGGGGLFKIANVSISNGADTVCSAKGPFYDSETGIIWYAYSFIAHSEGTFNVVIPNEGGAIIVFLDESNHEMPTNRFEIEGDINVSEDEDNGFYVFGDCSISRSGIN